MQGIKVTRAWLLKKNGFFLEPFLSSKTRKFLVYPTGLCLEAQGIT